MADLLRSFGVSVDITPGMGLGTGDVMRLQAAQIGSSFASYDMVRKMRASFQVLAPLLARHGEARVSLPGGCAIGARPVDLHLKALEAMGAKVELADGYVIASAKNGLKGAAIEFPFVSVGATETAMMAAVLARGETVIGNAAREPEIEDLALCLIAMGRRDFGAGFVAAGGAGRQRNAWRRLRRDARPDRDRHLRHRRRHCRRRGRTGGRAGATASPP